MSGRRAARALSRRIWRRLAAPAVLTPLVVTLLGTAPLSSQPVIRDGWQSSRLPSSLRPPGAKAFSAPPHTAPTHWQRSHSTVRPVPAAPRQSAPDRWFGRDKWLHAAVAASLQFTAYALLRDRGASRTSSHFGATLLTGAASVGKEWHDASSGGVFSRKDLVWDAVGSLTGSTVAHQVDG